MPRIPVPFGEWRPDLALLDNQFASEIENVVAGANAYKPFPGLLAFSTPLPGSERACGLTAARGNDGSWKIFAGTTTKLYKWNLSGWTDISRTTGGAYNVPDDALWSFAQFGTKLVAVQINDVPQVIDIDSGTNFAALGGSPPQATNVYVIGDFLVLSGLDANPRKIHWSAINDIGAWSPGLNLSDEQEFPDGGPVQGVSGGEIGYIVQERCIRTMQYLPGDTTYIFNFSRVLHDRGCISKYGFVCIGNNLYFVAEDGFYIISGQQVQPIGHDKVDDWFIANSDRDRRNQFQAFCFITAPHIAWAYMRTAGSHNYDGLIIFDWSNQKWAKAREEAQVWATSALSSVNLDLDTTGTEPFDEWLDVPTQAFQLGAFQEDAFQVTVPVYTPARPLDSFAYAGGRPLVGGIDENGALGALNGPNLPAVIETAEAHPSPGMRTFLSEAYPVIDDASAGTTVTAATRERLQDPVVWGQPAVLEITGSAALFASARLYRFRVNIPGNAAWTLAQGVQIDVQPDGSVA